MQGVQERREINEEMIHPKHIRHYEGDLQRAFTMFFAFPKYKSKVTAVFKINSCCRHFIELIY